MPEMPVPMDDGFKGDGMIWLGMAFCGLWTLAVCLEIVWQFHQAGKILL